MKNISVVMPVKNGDQYLSSILGQIEANINTDDEVLIVDDHSTDHTASLILDWVSKDSRFKYFLNPGFGIVDALNYGVQESKYDWIARFDADDKYPTNRLRLQRRLIDESVAAIFCDYIFWSENSDRLGAIETGITSSVVPISLTSAARTPHPGAIFSKRIFKHVGGYAPEDYPAEDLGLWLKMRASGNLISVGTPLLHYRLSSGSVTGTKRLESLAKKRELLTKHPITAAEVATAIESLPETLQIYREFNGSSRRKVLLALDFLRLFPAYPKRFLNIYFFRFFLGLLLNPKSWISVLNLFVERRHRNRIRGKISF
jgi:glycosyltransferase involved in cell wall biosynthesis